MNLPTLWWTPPEIGSKWGVFDGDYYFTIQLGRLRVIWEKNGGRAFKVGDE